MDPIDTNQAQELEELFQFFSTTLPTALFLQDGKGPTVTDTDQDPEVVTATNLQAVFHSIGLKLPWGHCQQMVEKYQRTEQSKGGLVLIDFIMFFAERWSKETSANELKEAFRVVDDDDDGFVDVSALQHVIKGLRPNDTREEHLALLNSAYPVDPNLQKVSYRTFIKEGVLDYSEFQQFLFTSPQERDHDKTTVNVTRDPELEQA
jgi:Ca2+-binding EF-hand superfamily protein